MIPTALKSKEVDYTGMCHALAGACRVLADLCMFWQVPAMFLACLCIFGRSVHFWQVVVCLPFQIRWGQALGSDVTPGQLIPQSGGPLPIGRVSTYYSTAG